jgi:hypothetical protein
VDYTRIWADAAGESHLERVVTGRTLTPAEQGVVELLVSRAFAVDRLHFVTVHADDQEPDWHLAPRRQVVVFLDGSVRIANSDGDAARLPSGSVVLVEDVEGKGHVTEHEPGEHRALVIPLDPDPDRTPG